MAAAPCYTPHQHLARPAPQLPARLPASQPAAQAGALAKKAVKRRAPAAKLVAATLAIPAAVAGDAAAHWARTLATHASEPFPAEPAENLPHVADLPPANFDAPPTET